MNGYTLVASHSNGKEHIYRRESDGILLKRTTFDDGSGVTQVVAKQYLAHVRGLVQWRFEDDPS